MEISWSFHLDNSSGDDAVEVFDDCSTVVIEEAFRSGLASVTFTASRPLTSSSDKYLLSFSDMTGIEYMSMGSAGISRGVLHRRVYPEPPTDKWVVVLDTADDSHEIELAPDACLILTDAKKAGQPAIAYMDDHGRRWLVNLKAMTVANADGGPSRPLLQVHEAEEEEEEEEGEPNPLLICPITHRRMVDPVCAADGHTYERAAIMRWLAHKRSSPMTNEAMAATVFTNMAMKKVIEADNTGTRKRKHEEVEEAQTEEEEEEEEATGKTRVRSDGRIEVCKTRKIVRYGIPCKGFEYYWELLVETGEGKGE